MKGWARVFSDPSVIAFLAVATLAGCATAKPQDSGRLGLLDRISAADHSRQSPRFAAITRTPSSLKQPAVSGTTQITHQQRAAIEVSVGQLHWPLAQVSITSPFGKRGKDFHEGIDLHAKVGTTVYAAQEGTVIYAGAKIRGYGRMVVIRHYREISTIYAHNSKLLVRIGQYVRQGQKIAISGNTGHSHGPHLHFEVRDGQAALNPLELIQGKSSAVRTGENTPPPTAPIASIASGSKAVVVKRAAASRNSSARVRRVGMIASSKPAAKATVTE